jgi:DNA-binding beta-propeller fold protein YncE
MSGFHKESDMRFASLIRSVLAFGACAAALALIPFASLAQFPPVGKVHLAVNPITNKTYALDELGNAVVVVDPDGSTRSVPVGTRPQFIAVDPAANRVYIANNDGGLSMTILDGATDTNLTPTPLAVGSLGPFAIDASRGLVYIVRLSSAARDEVTYFNAAAFTGGNSPWYSIAALMYQPTAIGLNLVTQDILVPGYATGRVAIIDGAYAGEGYPCGHADEPNQCPNLGTGTQPFTVAVDPVVNRAVGMSFNASSALWFVDIAAGTIANFAIDTGPAPLPAPGPRGLGLNTVTHKAYAIFDGKLVVADVAAGTFTVIADARFAGTSPVGVAVNAATNQVYVAADDGKLTVIDGASNARTPIAIPAGMASVGVNPVTNKVYVHGGGATPTVLDGLSGSASVPLTTTITPLAGNQGAANVTITMQASSGFAPTALPIRKVYWQLDGTTGAWQAASGSGPWTASLTGLSPGSHTIRAFAVDGQDAPYNTGPQSAPLVGAIASYTFTVPGAQSTTSLAASAATSVAGQPVTFTASVSGSAGTPTGTVAFRDGAATIAGCGSVSLAGGSAACTTSSLAVGSHSITASYSGSGTYASSASSAVTHTVAAPPVAPTVALASSKNPAIAGESITFTATLSGSRGAPTGTVAFRDNGATIPGCGAVPLASGVATCATAGLAVGTHPVTVHYAGNADYTAATSSAVQQVVNAAPQPQLTLSAGSVAFGGQSMGTTSPPQVVTISNTGTGSLTVSGIMASDAQFRVSHACGALAPGASCPVSVEFAPAVAAGALNSQVNVTGTLSVASNAPGSPATASLSGTAQKSLATHFYQSILRRAPDAGGREFWEAEAARVAQLGADVSEVWYALAMTFYTSAEYASFNRTDTAYLTDLYETFFNRAPDAAGLSYWNGQLAQGMPREMVLVAFMFSTEFRDFTTGIFGDTAARAEADVAGDFYRGLLARLPDSAGFEYWVGQFQAAQCAANPGDAVNGQVESISSAFSASPEYAARARSNTAFVVDLYNAFLRRGGDLAGMQFWVGQLDGGALTREQVRQAFVATPEFQARVQGVIAEGCR